MLEINDLLKKKDGDVCLLTVGMWCFFSEM